MNNYLLERWTQTSACAHFSTEDVCVRSKIEVWLLGTVGVRSCLMLSLRLKSNSRFLPCANNEPRLETASLCHTSIPQDQRERFSTSASRRQRVGRTDDEKPGVSICASDSLLGYFCWGRTLKDENQRPFQNNWWFTATVSRLTHWKNKSILWTHSKCILCDDTASWSVSEPWAIPKPASLCCWDHS